MLLTMEHFQFRNIYGEEKTFKLFKEAGFDGIDFSFNALGNGTAMDLENHIEKAKETKRLLEEYNLVCNQSHAPFGFKFGEQMDESNKNFLDMFFFICITPYL